jgi:Topoisomerase C-terminal repeat
VPLRLLLPCRYLQTLLDDGTLHRKSLLKTFDPLTLTLDQAVDILHTRDVSLGQHPDTGLDVMFKVGRFGPYYEHGQLRYSAGRIDDDFEPTMDHAMMRLDAKAKKIGARSGAWQVQCMLDLVDDWSVWWMRMRTWLSAPALPAHCFSLNLASAGKSQVEAATQAPTRKKSGKKNAPKSKRPATKSSNDITASNKTASNASSKGRAGSASAANHKQPAGSAASGSKAYHAWVKAHRQQSGADLTSARQAYRALDQSAKDAWRQEYEKKAS